MAKLLHLSRPSRRVSNAIRTWLAMRRQKRRRTGEAGGGVPAAPTSMWLEDRGDYVFVQWDINSTNEWGFRVYRLGHGVIGTVGPRVTEYADYDVEPGNYYGYFVVAYNGAGESDRSNIDGLDFQC